MLFFSSSLHGCQSKCRQTWSCPVYGDCICSLILPRDRAFPFSLSHPWWKAVAMATGACALCSCARSPVPSGAGRRGVCKPEQEAGVDLDRGRGLSKQSVQNVTLAGICWEVSHQKNTSNGHYKDYWYSCCLIPWPFYYFWLIRLHCSAVTPIWFLRKKIIRQSLLFLALFKNITFAWKMSFKVYDNGNFLIIELHVEIQALGDGFLTAEGAL